MAIFESISLSAEFPFRFLVNLGYRLTTPHLHSEYEIIYVEKGSINLGVGKELFKLREHQIYIIFPHIEHYIVPEKDSVRYVYQFTSALFGNILLQKDAIQFDRIVPNSCFWPEEIASTIAEILERIEEEVHMKQRGYELEVIRSLLQIQVLLIRNAYHQDIIYQEPKNIQKLKKVFQYVEDNYKNKIYLDEISEILGYNTEYFSRFFKKTIGRNFTDFLLDYRLTKAKWDLITTKDSIHQIIYKNGFQNTATFYRNFKEYTGYSPKAYRELHAK